MNLIYKYLGYILILFGLAFLLLFAFSVNSVEPQTKYLWYSLPIFIGGLFILFDKNKSKR